MAAQTLAETGDVHARVHAARKAIRRARSLIALVEAELDVEAADRALRRVCESLGSLRDARAIALAAGTQGRKSRDNRWKQASDALEQRADRLARREQSADPGFAKRRRALARAARLLQALPWDALARPGIRAGLVRQTRRVEKAARRAKATATPEDLHRWRRRTRRLRMQIDALAGLRLDIIGQDTTASTRLHRLSDALGERQDRTLLAATLRRMRTLEHRRALLEQLERS
ncbi:CHAD domain-containing protein [Pseudoxanthomonas daejeonensis]|uniref:CHAD domain-containing protein n=1 Tax=Pseudoxanthomonas daejeonensis TaxID=266062 RepID=UPI001F540DA1|nr:CHAD domain-containing protein [Pseudoxanthomonas daejeonensis]UNK57829.1 CHAD domain-containing protein [Pseudoxanthomonas daejeonensis]